MSAKMTWIIGVVVAIAVAVAAYYYVSKPKVVTPSVGILPPTLFLGVAPSASTPLGSTPTSGGQQQQVAVGTLGSPQQTSQTGTLQTVPAGPAPAPQPTTSPLQITATQGVIQTGNFVNVQVGIIGGIPPYLYLYEFADGFSDTHTTPNTTDSYGRQYPSAPQLQTAQVNVVVKDSFNGYGVNPNGPGYANCQTATATVNCQASMILPTPQINQITGTTMADNTNNQATYYVLVSGTGNAVWQTTDQSVAQNWATLHGASVQPDVGPWPNVPLNPPS